MYIIDILTTRDNVFETFSVIYACLKQKKIILEISNDVITVNIYINLLSKVIKILNILLILCLFWK